MKILYRTPNIIVDQHEWHAVVRNHYSRTWIAYHWRPLSAKPARWELAAAWQGPRPKGLWRFFYPYRKHMDIAMRSEAQKRAALARRGNANGAMLRNAA